MNKELKEYLDSIIDYEYINKDDYEIIEFIASFNNHDRKVSLYLGKYSIKMSIILECPICNIDIFTVMNLLNQNSDYLKAYHNDDSLYIECQLIYGDILNVTKEILNSLVNSDYEYISLIIDTIDKVNKIDKVELVENVISMLSEDESDE